MNYKSQIGWYGFKLQYESDASDWIAIQSANSIKEDYKKFINTIESQGIKNE